GSASCADAFYDLWSDDLPVYISSDAVLHAWHYSFQTCLEEIDAFVMARSLESFLDDLLLALEERRSPDPSENPFLARSEEDLDWYLTIARSLLDEEPVGARFPATRDPDFFIDSVQEAEKIAYLNVFGRNRIVDFTQFKPRGHSTTSAALSRYFRSLMWCFQTDFQLTDETENDESRAAARRQLAAASLLAQLIKGESLTGDWESMENVMAAVGGYGDALAPPQLLELLESAGLSEVGSVSNENIAEFLLKRVESGNLGVQNIRSRPTLSPRNTQQQAVLPRSFALFSQRFVLDSWAMSKVVFDSIIFDDNGIPEESDKVQRRIPSGLDVAFTTFGNNTALPILIDRMEDRDGRAFRDGYPYQNNLAAARRIIDGQGEEAWAGNLYHQWLKALRTLSPTPTGAILPHAMQTRAWARKDLNTQLASWTQLRHDTVLYAKQSATALTLCHFPDGYVEPRPAFWRQLRLLAESMEGLTGALPAEGTFRIWDTSLFVEVERPVIDWRDEMTGFFRDFAACIGRLENLVAKQMRGDPFNETDLTFIDEMMQGGGTITSGGDRRYDGWYSGLYRRKLDDALNNGSAKWPALVTDVHTDFPDAISGDPGTILHEAVGGVPFLLIALEREGGRKAVYGGPVLSYYEFDLGQPMKRLNDEEWQSMLKYDGHVPKNSSWTGSYLVPAEGGLPVPQPLW
ncbi:MAG: DUF3160 domain-containing protein, partial [Verrucomicrobiota bacterium]